MTTAAAAPAAPATPPPIVAPTNTPNAQLIPPGMQPAPAAPAPAAETQTNIDALVAAVQSLVSKGKDDPAAAAPANVAPPAGDLNAIELADVDDPMVRAMATSLKMGAPADLDLNRALGNAIERGDAALIDKAYLREKFGDQADLRIRLAEGIVEAVAAQSQALTDSIKTAAGGEAAWEASRLAFNTKAPATLKAAAKVLLNSGIKDQVQAGAQLVIEFAKGQGYLPGNSPTIGGNAPTQGAGAPLSSTEYKAELAKLAGRTNARDFAEQADALRARRIAGRNAGIN